MNVVAYCRFSSDAQKDGYSIEAQQRAIKDYCKRNALKLLRFYVDEARSGTNDQREQFQTMIRDIDAIHDFEGIVVHKIDRFSRSKKDFALYRDILETKGVKLISTVEHIDDTPESEILMSVLEAFAAFYPKNLSREVRKGMNEAARKGLATGGPHSYGYETDPITKKYVIVEREAAIVRSMYDMILEGYNLNEIAHALDGMGVTTKKGNRMSTKAIRRILTSEKYKGVSIFNSYSDYHRRKALTPKADLIRVENAFPAIISKDKWDKVQELLSAGKRGSYARKTKEDYILSGILYCGECREKMVGSSSTKKVSGGTSEYRYYTCPNKRRKTCSLSNIKKSYIEDLVSKIIKEDLFSGKVLQKVVDDLYNEIQSATVLPDETLAEYKSIIANTNKKIERLLNLYLDGEMEKEEYSKKRAELLLSKEFYQNHVNQSMYMNDIDKDEIRAKLLRFGQRLLEDNGVDLKRKKAAIATIVEKIEVYKEKIRVTFKFDVTADKVPNGDPYGIRTRECILERDMS